MPVTTIVPGGVMDVTAGQIAGATHIYRTGAGYDGPGNVGWQPAQGPLQMWAMQVGETITTNLNSQAGMIANGCPSNIQVLWNTGMATMEGTRPDGALALLRAANRLTATGGFGDGDAAQQAMTTLNAQWYNAVVSSCGLDPSTFQLIQGSAPLGTTSETLWNMFDVVPPLSVTNYYNPSQANIFSADYGAIINNLKPQNAGTFQAAMGDYYAPWTTFLKSQTSLPQGGVLALFNTWSQINMPVGQAQQAYTAYQEVSQGVVPVAVSMWLAAGGGTGGVKAYNATISQLQQAIAASPSKTVTFDSATQSSDVSHSWAKGEAAGIIDFFEGGATGSFDQLTVKLASSTLSINASFDHLVTFAAGPLAKPSSDPILSAYQPWYDSAALNLAYQNDNNVVWNPTPPTWNDTFGPTGNMLRTTSALVIVDGISVTMTSNVSYSSSEQTQVQAAAEAGFFPFFEAEASGGWTHNTSFNDQGFMTITSTSPAGNPVVLGAIVTPISGVMMI